VGGVSKKDKGTRMMVHGIQDYRFRIVFLLVFVAFFSYMGSGACLSADDEAQEKRGSSTQVSEDKYVIGPTDVLEIQVWKEPNLSRTVPVRPDGKITLPLLDDVQAAGLTPLELKAKLEKELAKFVENPVVSVSVQEIHSKNIYVLGRVATPGAFPLQQGLTVLQALSLAGGLAEWADEKNIVIIRTENGKQKKIKFNYSRVSKGKDLDKNILLKPGDTIIVP